MKKEVKNIIHEWPGETIRKSELAAAVVSRHQEYGPINELSWYTSRAYDSVSEAIGQVFRGSFNFAGFDRLQSRYSVRREGETFYVPIAQMTDLELVRKTNEHRLTGEGHLAHAEQLDRYRRERAMVATSAQAAEAR